MDFISKYSSPLGEILLAAEENALTGLWFVGQKHFALQISKEAKEKETDIFKQTKQWLNIYFKGEQPKFTPSINLRGTSFQIEVWNILLSIPYGKTTTYKDIAKIIAEKRGLKKMSAQAVGNAIGRNPISIIIPCHRVIGTNYSLTGYAGGINKKEKLLQLEGLNTNNYKMP